MAQPAPSQQSIRFRGRSFLALVLAPELPLAEWLEQVDAWAGRSPGFFLGRPIVLDLTGLDVARDEIAWLVASLASRDIRIMGVEGVEQGALGADLPPALRGGRPASMAEPVEAPRPGTDRQAAAADLPPAAASEPARAAAPLILDAPVRSGQSVVYTEGDVTVMGSVASGAEVVAGGSIHIYGALRGRAIAGSLGQARARIFCRKLEAELVAIDGLYKTADDIHASLRGLPVQAWLEDDTIKLAVLD
ncbi:MAG: septum site-determining protein MinC [Alsobacter sp.]